MLGLACPPLRYGCCPDLNTWRHGLPCKHLKSIEDSENCYKGKDWTCGQVKVRDDVVTKGLVGERMLMRTGRCVHVYNKVQERQEEWKEQMALGDER
jgi:hypothetical protein